MRISDRQAARHPGWHAWISTGNLLVGSLIALVAAVFSLGVTCARAADRVDSMESRMSTTDHRVSLTDLNQAQKYADLERRIESLQQQQTVTQNDVLWIRREMERQK